MHGTGTTDSHNPRSGAQRLGRSLAPRRDTQRWRRRGGLLVLGLASAVALSACGASGNSTSSSGSSASGSSASAASSTKVPLVVYAAEGYDQAETQAFQQATGIPTVLSDHSTGTLLARIQAEQGNPQWGVLWTDGSNAYAALDQQHALLRGYEPTGALTSLGASMVPADKSYIPTGLTIAGALVYNSATVKNPPTTWQQLLSPKWRGAIGMNNPAVSGPTYTFVSGLMQQLGGVAAGERYFSALKANGLQIFPTNKVTLGGLLTGQIKIAIVQNSAGLGFEYKNPSIRVAYPSKVTLLPGVIGIDAHVSATEQAEAKRFAQFVYSPQGQALMLSGDPHGDSLFFPIIQGTSQHKLVPQLSSLPTQSVNPSVWGPREATLNQWFTNNIVQ